MNKIITLQTINNEQSYTLTCESTSDDEELWYNLQRTPPRLQEEVFRTRLFNVPISSLKDAIQILESQPENGLLILPYYHYDPSRPLVECPCCIRDSEYLLRMDKEVVKKDCTYFVLISEEESESFYRLGFHDTFESFYSRLIEEW